ncbi:YgfZ/GcvT domain-containing protein [Aeoliella sp.]|uniref:CAF17-like 4Fe-4S cluster assembly/insertion protein YgfZ n=1 Tax=Aeoliella sp. TaxID=2795800 RepID=UPI003CCBCDDA
MTLPTGSYFTDWPGSVLEVTGDDRIAFLHNMCTADVKQMAVGESREAFFTNVKGHVLCHAVLHSAEDRVTAVVLADDAAPLAAQLDRYVIREDVTLRANEGRPALVVGSENEPGWIPFPLLPEPAWVAPANAGMADRELAEASRADLDGVRVAAGWPLGGVDFGEGTLPQELSRDARAISFTKGCYLGQETIARLDALGHVNKQMVRVRAIDGAALAAGTALTVGDKQVGTVTTAAELDDGYAGLAMVRREANAAGTKLTTDAGEVVVESLAD